MSDWGKARVPDPWVHLAPLNVHETTSEAIFFLLFLEDERGGEEAHVAESKWDGVGVGVGVGHACAVKAFSPWTPSFS